MATADAPFATDGAVAWLTFNRPAARNAMTWAMYDALTAACDRADADAQLRVLVVRGAGHSFGAGTDISQFADFTTGQDGLDYERRLEACLDRVERATVPTIAQVDGVAAGAGLAIALACDLRVCTPTTRFGVPIARTLGNALSVSNCARMLDHLGPALTKDLLLTGRLIEASDAAAVGFATRLVASEGLDEAVADLARSIAANAPLTERAAKAALRHLAAERRRSSDEVEACIAACYASADFREGVAAFLGKRAPRFRGR